MYKTKCADRFIGNRHNFVCVVTLALLFLAVNTANAQFTFSNEDWGPTGCNGLWNGLIIDPYGYSDAWSLNEVRKPASMDNWHCNCSREELSGEWAAAVYYTGIPSGTCNGNPCAMWLTPDFICPNWPTNSNFGSRTASTVDADNATEAFQNQQIKVTIDYHVADLGRHYRGPGAGDTTSPMNLGRGAVAYGGRFVLFQTYTLENLTQNTLTDVEFYQMLHAQPDDDIVGSGCPTPESVWNATVYSVYPPSTPCGVTDPLASYVFPPAAAASHQTGDFIYDITQWNDPGREGIENVTYIGFSSLIEPDAVDADVFPGVAGKPIVGTHLNVEERNLNGRVFWAGVDGPDADARPDGDEIAAAMMWKVTSPNGAPGQLLPGVSEAWSITIILMAGHTDYDGNNQSDSCDDPNSLPLFSDLTDANGDWVLDSAERLDAESLPLCDLDEDGTPDQCEAGYCRGDSNCSGSLNAFDIDPFVAAVNGRAAWEAFFAPNEPPCPYGVNDINGDCLVNDDDVDPFVARLLQAPPCP